MDVRTGSRRFRETVLVAFIAALVFAKPCTAPADELIPAVSSLNAPADIVFVDAGTVTKCLETAHPGALCLSLDRVLNKEGRLANMRDVRWLLGSFGLTGDERVVIYADDEKTRDAMAAVLYLAGQDRVGRLINSAQVDFTGQGVAGALSRRALFVGKVRLGNLQPAPFGRVSSAQLADFVSDLNRDPSALFMWPVGYL